MKSLKKLISIFRPEKCQAEDGIPVLTPKRMDEIESTCLFRVCITNGDLVVSGMKDYELREIVRIAKNTIKN